MPKTGQSLCCTHTQNISIDLNLDLLTRWIRQHGGLKEAFAQKQ